MASPWSSSKKIKFFYSYGGKIMRRENDGKLRYIGGTNRIITVDRDISYTELIVKLWDTCGPSMSLRCKLPEKDLDSLFHVTSDKDLANVIEQYDRTRTGMEYFRIRAILDPLPPPPLIDIDDDSLDHKKAATCTCPVSQLLPDVIPLRFYHAYQAGYVGGFSGAQGAGRQINVRFVYFQFSHVY